MTIIETKRLTICEISANDASFIMELLNDPDWLRFIGDKGVRTLEDARNYILNGPMQHYEQLGFGLFLVKSKNNDTSLGICGLLKRDYLDHVDLGFAFLPKYRGRGYATESANAVLRYGKNKFDLKHIMAIVQPDNIKSINVLKEIGFKYVQQIEPQGNAIKLSLFIHSRF